MNLGDNSSVRRVHGKFRDGHVLEGIILVNSEFRVLDFRENVAGDCIKTGLVHVVSSVALEIKKRVHGAYVRQI